MKNVLLIVFGKTASFLIKAFRLGHGSTWPGHLALKLHPAFIKELLNKTQGKVIIIAGTNGKTTTTKLVHTILEKQGGTIIRNESGANLLNGIASALLLNADFTGKVTADYFLFEVDENALPGVMKNVSPDVVILLNLFRDQLDRYGEIDSIVEKWHEAFTRLPNKTMFVANADDPKIAYVTKDAQAIFYGLEEEHGKEQENETATDSTYCPACGGRLTYLTRTYSHLGKWKCAHCGFARPELSLSQYVHYPMMGSYNKYNTIAAVAAVRHLGIHDEMITDALQNFTPAFGRQERLTIKDKSVQIFLSKNPTSFNESLKVIKENKAKHVLLVLNDRVADGQDVSWIWDIDLESYLPAFTSITISGDRVYDMGLRIKYAECTMPSSDQVHMYESLEAAVKAALKRLPENEALFILPTYTAMLEIRKLLSGKKIL